MKLTTLAKIALNDSLDWNSKEHLSRLVNRTIQGDTSKIAKFSPTIKKLLILKERKLSN